MSVALPRDMEKMMAKRHGCAILLLMLAAGGAEARKPAPLTGTLTLDMDAPIVTAIIGKVTLRLRVAPEQKRLIELNRAAANRIDLPFEKGVEAEVGREKIPAITAGAKVRIEGRDFMAQIASHDRDCCRDVDGEIGMTLLPYAVVRFVRGNSAAGPERHFAIEDSIQRGPETRLRIGKEDIVVAFSLTRAQSVATYAAGSILASARGGALRTGPAEPTEAAFGVIRPTRILDLKNPATISGFSFSTLPVRISDFGGSHDFPVTDAEPGDIVVKHRVPPQEAWPLVLIGRDRLDRCSELRFDRITKLLSLICAP